MSHTVWMLLIYSFVSTGLLCWFCKSKKITAVSTVSLLLIILLAVSHILD